MPCLIKSPHWTVVFCTDVTIYVPESNKGFSTKSKGSDFGFIFHNLIANLNFLSICLSISRRCSKLLPSIVFHLSLFIFLNMIYYLVIKNEEARLSRQNIIIHISYCTRICCWKVCVKRIRTTVRIYDSEEKILGMWRM